MKDYLVMVAVLVLSAVIVVGPILVVAFVAQWVAARLGASDVVQAAVMIGSIFLTLPALAVILNKKLGLNIFD